MANLLKILGYETLLSTALELIVETQIARVGDVAGRAFTIPAAVVLQICKRFNVIRPEGQQAVIDSFRSVGAAITSVVMTIDTNRSAK